MFNKMSAYPQYSYVCADDFCSDDMPENDLIIESSCLWLEDIISMIQSCVEFAVPAARVYHGAAAVAHGSNGLPMAVIVGGSTGSPVMECSEEAWALTWNITVRP